jgi:hypothetical protein
MVRVRVSQSPPPRARQQRARVRVDMPDYIRHERHGFAFYALHIAAAATLSFHFHQEISLLAVHFNVNLAWPLATHTPYSTMTSLSVESDFKACGDLGLPKLPARFGAQSRHDGLMSFLLRGASSPFDLDAAELNYTAALPSFDKEYEAELSEVATQVLGADLTGDVSDANVSKFVALFSAFEHNPAVPHGLEPKRWSATAAPGFAAMLLQLASGKGAVAADRAFSELGAQGIRAMLAMFANNAHNETDFKAADAVAERAKFDKARTDLLASLIKEASSKPPVTFSFGKSTKVTTTPSKASKFGFKSDDDGVGITAVQQAAIDQVKAAIVVLNSASDVDTFNFASSTTSTALKSAIGVGCQPFLPCVMALPRERRDRVLFEAGAPVPSNDTGAAIPLAAMQAARGFGHPQVGSTMANLSAVDLGKAIPDGSLGGHGGFANVLPAVPGTHQGVQTFCDPPPGCPRPFRAIEPGSIVLPGYFEKDPDEPDQILKARAEELVLSAAGGWSKRCRSVKLAVPKNLAEYLRWAQRMTMWMQGTLRWDYSVANSHLKFCHKLAALVADCGHSLSAMLSIDKKFRTNIFTGKFQSWDDYLSLAALMQFSQLAARSGPPASKKQRTLSTSTSYKFTKDASGTDICLRFQSSGCAKKDCKSKKGVPCQRAHVCALCQQPGHHAGSGKC